MKADIAGGALFFRVRRTMYILETAIKDNNYLQN